MSVDTEGSADTAATSTQQHARATVKPEKATAVAELAQAFRGSSAAVLTEYRGLTVKQISDLRVALGAGTSYAVVKNTLTKIAATDAGIEGLHELLSGPTAVAFINGEPVEAAKALRDFAKAHPALVVKGGVMDGKPLSVEEVRKLADLESREVLLAKMAGALLASLSNAVYLLNAPLAQAARLAGALQAKATEDPSILRGGAGTPAPAAQEAPEATDEVAPEASTDEASTDEAAPEASTDEAAAPEAAPAETDSDTNPTSTEQ
jgi:large subunit ribosomal protein L10